MFTGLDPACGVEARCAKSQTSEPRLPRRRVPSTCRVEVLTKPEALESEDGNPLGKGGPALRSLYGEAGNPEP